MPSFRIKTDKRVGFWGAPKSIPRKTHVTEKALIESGQNTGNMFIGSGLYDALDAKTKEYFDIYNHPPEEFDEKFDCLFIPASNFVFEYTDLSAQFKFFSKTKARIFMFGLGSQVQVIRPVKLMEGTERFLKLVEERSSSIGVRGEVTAEIMGSMGYKSVRVVGCPSMLAIPKSFTDPNQALEAGKKVGGNFTHNGRRHSFDPDVMKVVESRLFQALLAEDGYYVLQNERPEIELMTTLPVREELDDQDMFCVNSVAKAFGLQLASQELLDFLRWRLALFFEVREWIEFTKRLGFSFGTRFHGNVAAILGGVSAHVICHDLRTLELCDTYHIPHSDIRDLNDDVTIRDLASRSDMSGFQARFAQLCSVWASFTLENGLDCNVET